jgi:hypothetical protein
LSIGLTAGCHEERDSTPEDLLTIIIDPFCPVLKLILPMTG